MGWPLRILALPKPWSRMLHRNVHSIPELSSELCHFSLKWWWHHAVGLGTRAFPRSWIHPGQPPHPRPTPLAPSPRHCSSQLRRCHRFFFFWYLCPGKLGIIMCNVWYCRLKRLLANWDASSTGFYDIWVHTHTTNIIYITIFTHQRVGTKVILLRDNWGMDGWFMTGGWIIWPDLTVFGHQKFGGDCS